MLIFSEELTSQQKLEFRKVRNLFAEMTLGSLGIYFVMSNLGFNLMMVAISKYHPIEQSMAMILLLGVMGSITALLHLVDEITKNTKQRMTEERYQ
jgi:hypothetical protein